MFQPDAHKFKALSPTDGTVDFYIRVGALAGADKVLLDLGAGRGGWFEEDDNALRHGFRHMKGRFGKVVAADVDPVVMENKSSDINLLMEEGRVPLEDGSVDVIVADYVLEHIPDVQAFAEEVDRLLKPGGWFCARTPHKLSYVALSARLMNGPVEDLVMKFAQPERKEADIFPKEYRLNTMRAISAAFPGWRDHSYTRRCDPAYYFGRKSVYMAFDFLHRLMPGAFSGNIFVFLQKG